MVVNLFLMSQIRDNTRSEDNMTSLDNLCAILNLKPYQGTPYSVKDGHIEHNGNQIPITSCIAQVESYILGQQVAVDNLKQALGLIKRRII